jgi:hypothetical protein
MSRSFYLFLVAFGILVLLAIFGRSLSGNAPLPSGNTPTATPGVTDETPTENTGVTPGSQTSRVRIFLVAVDDNGKTGKKIGCGDSLIPVTRDITPTTAPLKAALEELLSLKAQSYGESGLYNALYQSNLTVERAVITDGKADVSLRGTYTLGGTCDTPRFSGQLQETARQFPSVEEVDVLLNGMPIAEALSEK